MAKPKAMKNMLTIGYQPIDKERGYFDYIIREQLFQFTESKNCTDEIYNELWKAVGTITGILNGLNQQGGDDEDDEE